MLGIGRREFITLLGGAAAVWPLRAHAQRFDEMRLIGLLGGSSPEAYNPFLSALHRGMSESGYVEGRNLTIEYRWAEDQYDRLLALAADLVNRQVKVIATIGGTPVALAAKAATATIPIVFVVGGDPIKLGLVSSFNRPDGNVTGVSQFASVLFPKRLELIRELLPTKTMISVLVNPTNPNAETIVKDTEAAAHALGQRTIVLRASSETELSSVLATGIQRSDALIVMDDAFFLSQRNQLSSIAASYRVPAVYPWPEFVKAGGLMSYGTSLGDAYRLSGIYVARLLSGDRPANLPVLRPTKFELVINMKTARTLGLEIPPTLLARADEVIE
jgi:ABC-type uncharacterized transport system substrate-binding protein